MVVAVDSAEFGLATFTVNPNDFIGVIDDLTSSFPLEGEFEFVLDVCDDWPSGRATRRDREPRASQIPTLILSGKFDNRAPPAYSALIMQTFTKSKQIVFANASHGIPGPTTVVCFREIVSAFAHDTIVFPAGACATSAAPLKVSRDLP